MPTAVVIYVPSPSIPTSSADLGARLGLKITTAKLPEQSHPPTLEISWISCSYRAELIPGRSRGLEMAAEGDGKGF